MIWEPRYIKKLMGWCPTKNSLQNEMQEGCFSNVKLENINIQLSPASTDLQESRTLNVRVSLFDSRWITIALIITFFTIIISLLLWVYVPEDSYLIIFSGIILFLFPITLFINRPKAVTVTPGKIRIKKPMRKPIVVEKKDIMQISATKNYNHSIRWLARVFCIILIPLNFILGIPRNLQYIKYIEVSFSNYVDFSLFLGHLATVTILLVLFYNGELLTPYQWALKVTTNSKLEITFFTNEPEELTSFLKNEIDKK
jgi:hypothetical protein